MQFVRVFLSVVAAVSAVLPARAQSQYSGDGTPTGLEEEIRWRVNRGRFDSASENLTRNTTYTDVPASSGPLAPNQDITLAARHQSEDLAKANLFQHNTVPNSLYYNATNQPMPWDRMRAEGYTWNSAGENIAAGYSGAETAYVGWWNSAGHRANMYNGNLREIGNGYYYWSSSTYRSYYTMDLGSSGSACFFTDTTFQDQNGNGTYEQTEGIGNVAVRLQTGTGPLSAYDVSSAVGSFAIPLPSLATGQTVQVVLSNTTASSLVLSIPLDYRNYSSVSLAPGQSVVYGSFTFPASTANVGFRNVTPLPILPPSPSLNLACSIAGAQLSWTSSMGSQYQPQYSFDCLTWTPLTNGFVAGTGTNLTFVDSNVGSSGAKFYRLLVQAP